MRALPVLLAALALGCAHRARPQSAAEWRRVHSECHAGDVFACHWVGIAESARGDDAAAAPRFQAACEAGLADACAALGVAYEDGLGVPKDLERAFALYVRACDAGSGHGCNNLGVAWFHGRGTAKAPLKSTPLYERACRLGWDFGCINHAFAVAEGRGVPKDLGYAAATWRRLCPDYDTACRHLANLVANDDLHQAIPIAEEGCRAGGLESCAQAALFLRKADRLPEATRYARTACSRGDDVSCYWLGVILDQQNPAEDAEVERTLGRVCAHGDSDACYQLSQAHWRHRGLSDAVVEELLTSCRMGQNRGCIKACELFRKGKTAVAQCESACAQACRGGHQPACEAPPQPATSAP